MSVKELIEKLKKCPQDYEVVFESGDAYGSAYTSYVDGINIDNKKEQVELVEFQSMLSNFTDEELRQELKRRAKLRRLNAVRKPTEYIYLKGTVERIDNIRWTYRDGSKKYYPFCQWRFRIKDFECDEQRVIDWTKYYNDYKCAMLKSKSPKIGDKVIIKIRKTKVLTPYSLRCSKIIDVEE